MKIKAFLFWVIGPVAAIFVLAGCAGMQIKPDEKNFKPPVVKLSQVEVAHYWGWWYFKKTVEPSAGVKGDYGAPLDLAFVFDVQNPNDYPIQLESLKFTVAFEEFDLNTVGSVDAQWIPPGKTNQLRVHAMFDGQQSMLSLLVTGGFKLQQKGLEPGAAGALKQLGQWWEGIQDFAFPVYVKEGTAIFRAGEVSKAITFEAQYP